MPRRARLLIPGVPLHVIQRGNNRGACFFSDDDYVFYLKQLFEQARQHGCAIHSYCLMNHVHLLLTPSTEHSVSRMMKGLGQRYVQYVNRAYRRTGTLWEGRFRSCLLQEENYVLACYRYIELNPVRARIVEHPAEYQWSSYRINAQSEPSVLVNPHSIYTALATEGVSSAKNYRELFALKLDPKLVEQIRCSTNGNYALGSTRFSQEVEEALGRRASRGNPGRPKIDK